jgi:hypothetical protein
VYALHNAYRTIKNYVYGLFQEYHEPQGKNNILNKAETYEDFFNPMARYLIQRIPNSQSECIIINLFKINSRKLSYDFHTQKRHFLFLIFVCDIIHAVELVNITAKGKRSKGVKVCHRVNIEVYD